MAVRILIVEDDAALVTLLSYNLERAGYAVTAATSAEEGEHHLAATTFDLVHPDWMLPDRSGVEFCTRI